MLTLKRTLLEFFNVENNGADFSVSVSFASKAARECTIRYIYTCCTVLRRERET